MSEVSAFLLGVTFGAVLTVGVLRLRVRWPSHSRASEPTPAQEPTASGPSSAVIDGPTFIDSDGRLWGATQDGRPRRMKSGNTFGNYGTYQKPEVEL